MIFLHRLFALLTRGKRSSCPKDPTADPTQRSGEDRFGDLRGFWLLDRVAGRDYRSGLFRSGGGPCSVRMAGCRCSHQLKLKKIASRSLSPKGFRAWVGEFLIARSSAGCRRCWRTVGSPSSVVSIGTRMFGRVITR